MLVVKKGTWSVQRIGCAFQKNACWKIFRCTVNSPMNERTSAAARNTTLEVGNYLWFNSCDLVVLPEIPQGLAFQVSKFPIYTCQTILCAALRTMITWLLYIAGNFLSLFKHEMAEDPKRTSTVSIDMFVSWAWMRWCKTFTCFWLGLSTCWFASAVSVSMRWWLCYFQEKWICDVCYT